MYGAILKNGEEYFTYLLKVFNAINNAQQQYNWLITDCECYPKSSEIDILFSNEYCWLSGNDLTNIVKNEDIQWIWAVLSGFDKDISLNKVLEYPLPYANGYPGFWNNPVSIQHPLACVEIVPWDASLTLIISKDEKIVKEFLESFQLGEDLSQYNAR